MAEDYEKKVEVDAWDAVYDLEDEIVIGAGVRRRFHDDIAQRTYLRRGTSSRHETHTGNYDLKEAAELLDQLDEYEEADERAVGRPVATRGHQRPGRLHLPRTL
jgi:hypothetical protein